MNLGKLALNSDMLHTCNTLLSSTSDNPSRGPESLCRMIAGQACFTIANIEHGPQHATVSLWYSVSAVTNFAMAIATCLFCNDAEFVGELRRDCLCFSGEFSIRPGQHGECVQGAGRGRLRWGRALSHESGHSVQGAKVSEDNSIDNGERTAYQEIHGGLQ
jgi:hypothetical protein